MNNKDAVPWVDSLGGANALAANMDESLARAKRLVEDGRLILAQSLLEQIIAEDNSCRPALELMARLLMENKQYLEAAEYFNGILRYYEEEPKVHNALGTALALGGRFDQALQHLERAVHLAPGERVYLANLGKFWMMAERWQEAAPLLERALAVSKGAKYLEIMNLLDQCRSQAAAS